MLRARPPSVAMRPSTSEKSSTPESPTTYVSTPARCDARIVARVRTSSRQALAPEGFEAWHIAGGDVQRHPATGRSGLQFGAPSVARIMYWSPERSGAVRNQVPALSRAAAVGVGP